ncbi:MAG: TetR/AcrR family transcriptional regulator [Leptospiraceae bacterium]
MSSSATRGPSGAKRGRPALTAQELEEGRQHILSVARSLFQKDGYEAVTIRKIMEHTSRSPMMFYRYFANKRAVIRFIWADILTNFFDHCKDSISRIQSPEFRLEGFLRAAIHFWLDRPDDFRILYLNQDRLESDEDSYFAHEPEGYAQSEIIDELLLEWNGQINAQDLPLFRQHIILQVLGMSFSLIVLPELPWRPASELIDETVKSLFLWLRNKLEQDRIRPA